MRASQYFGLTDDAVLFLQENTLVVPAKVCPSCGAIVEEGKSEECYNEAEVDECGGFPPPPLYRYDLKDGTKVKEVIQAQPWSSGPCSFLCLEDEEGNRMYEWLEKEIEACI